MPRTSGLDAGAENLTHSHRPEKTQTGASRGVLDFDALHKRSVSGARRCGWFYIAVDYCREEQKVFSNFVYCTLMLVVLLSSAGIRVEMQGR